MGMESLSPRRFPRLWMALTLAFLAGLGGGYLLAALERPPHACRDFPVHSGEGRLTNPLLDFEVMDPDNLRELRPFEGEMRALIASLKKEAAAEEISVYFRDLNNGLWVGAGEEKEFVPGSLFKVPLIIACLSQAERDPAFIERKIPFRDPVPRLLAEVHYPPGFGLQPGREYTVRELVRRTARFSDNVAAYLLQGAVDPERLKKVFYDLDLDGERIVRGESHFSAVEYGRFFRILYNASYLSRAMSELALGDFTDSTFTGGLVAGVPQGTTVAHKFGEHIEKGPRGETILLHDAGIIYHPKHPYLLCVMTKGRDYRGLERSIAAVSALAWRQVEIQSWMRSP